MAEYTSEENQELVEALKGPRYYRILIQGYGGESAYMKISKEAHDFWKPICEEHGDSDLVNYLVSAEDGDFDFAHIDSVPPEANFLSDDEQGDGSCSSWYEAPTEFEHTFGVAYDQARIDIDEVANDDYNAKLIKEIICGVDVPELVDNILEETDNEIEIIEMGCCPESDAEYICQMYSAEKGSFFDGVVETIGEFDLKKLKIYTTEYLNGEDTITSVEYNGVEVDNAGGDTNGKGYYASVWKN